MEPEEAGLSKLAAVMACTALAFFYVAILYAPTVILRLPPPISYKEFMIRRFICAVVSSIVSVVACGLILPIRSREASVLFGVFGIRVDHIWQAVVFPLSLTSLMYAGSLMLKSMLLLNSMKEHAAHGGGISLDCIKNAFRDVIGWIDFVAHDVSAWRNYVVAPVTEELVFRACMIPLLLCRGFRISSVIFLCPTFFSLAHLNHWMKIYSRENYSFFKASMVTGLQLAYTVVFGSYASFLFIRTGHIFSPLVAHIFCNLMGLPVLFAQKKGIVSVAFVAGLVAFACLIFPVTEPGLYNDRTSDCPCWQGYCSWS
ncbi:CAAX prenyl protease 2 [Tripterygium wilfordii]|uniref:intramembrane prenyl-peptidase Rce1 n=1 Tax=Tripterygium wilfordii TaxID=458696 RepID=A0A7J7CTQ4_TRIWF|nr:CAAX prenyl protease 2-like isoform X2 [Tripterygium wilfordii]KAF5737460.1 CAAX prenyl protease 2 [Tripterygium wilfordii]